MGEVGATRSTVGNWDLPELFVGSDKSPSSSNV